MEFLETFGAARPPAPPFLVSARLMSGDPILDGTPGTGAMRCKANVGERLPGQ